MRKKYRPFKEARKFVRSLDLKKENEWNVYCKSGKKPADIPLTVGKVYKNKGWTSMGDWLGTGYVANQKRQYRPFKEARKFARSLDFKNRNQWSKFCKSKKRPLDIPVTPDRAYKKEFQGMGDWLGTGYVANSKREYRTFKDAKRFACRQGLKGQSEWVEYAKKNKKLLEKLKIPAHPAGFYKNEFLGYGDWLGTGNIQNSQRKFWSFEKARSFARELGLKTLVDWKEYCKSGKLSKNIPTNPNRTYEKEWISWGDWLGNDKVTNQEKAKNWSSAKEARIEIKKIAKDVFGGKPFTPKDWINAHKAGKIPANLPRYLQDIYDPDYRKRKESKRKKK